MPKVHTFKPFRPGKLACSLGNCHVHVRRMLHVELELWADAREPVAATREAPSALVRRAGWTLGDWPRDKYLELRLQCLLVAKARHSYLLPEECRYRDCQRWPVLVLVPLSPPSQVQAGPSHLIAKSSTMQTTTPPIDGDSRWAGLGWAGLGEARQTDSSLEAAPPHIIVSFAPG